MSRFSLSESRWCGLESDWPIVGVPSIPDLESTVFHRYGAKQGNFHTFVDDWRLESIWRDSALRRDRVLGVVCTAPDFSVYWNDPLPQVVYQCWRSRVVAWAWETSGAVVIPVIQFGAESSWHMCVQGIRSGSVLAVRGPSRSDDMGRWRSACQYWREIVSPSLVLQFGRADGADIWPNVLIRPLRFKPV